MTPAPRALKIYSHTWEWGSSATAHTRGAPLRMLLGTMYLLFSWIYWGSLVYISSAQFSLAAPTQEKEQKQIVVPFMEVFERSSCRVRKTLVNIYHEYPDEVELIFKPAYVELDRCSGCCPDETLECIPVEWSNITMQILRASHTSQVYHLKSFLEHKSCTCRPKEIKDKPEKKAKRGKGLKRKRKKIRYKSHRFHCEPCTDTERRKHLFVQDPQTCKCSCKYTDSRCKTKQLELNERTCRCEKPRR